MQLPARAALPELPDIVARASGGPFHTLTTNGFCEEQLARLAGAVRNVQRMNLEEIFVANVIRHREACER